MLTIQTCRRRCLPGTASSWRVRLAPPVIQHQTLAIRTVQETAEALQRQQLDRAVDVAVTIQLTYSKRSPSVKLGGAGTERFSRHQEVHDRGDD